MEELKDIRLINKPGLERAILSIIVKDKDKIIECYSDGVYAEHFSVKANQIIYSVCVFLAQREEVERLDHITIYNTMGDESKKIIDEIGGLDYLEALFVSSINSNLSFHIKELKMIARKRQIYEIMEQVKNDIIEGKSDEEVLVKLEEDLYNVSINDGDDIEVNKVGSGLRGRLQEIINNPKEILGLPLNWKTWDKTTQGLCPNDLTVVCAESKTGKSTLLLNMSKILSIDYGVAGLYIDTEMTTEEQEFRMLSIISGVPFEEIRNGQYTKDTEYGTAQDKIEAVENALNKMENSNFYHVYCPNFSIDKVSALVRRYKIKHNIAYFVFDYIKLPDSEVKSLQNAQEWQRLGYFTSCLKNLCGVCKIPCISAAQANRTSIGNTNQDANSLGGSYRILQLATRLCFLRNKLDNELMMEGYRCGNQVLKIAYQRNGSSNGIEINMQFDKPILRMYEHSKREY